MRRENCKKRHKKYRLKLLLMVLLLTAIAVGIYMFFNKRKDFGTGEASTTEVPLEENDDFICISELNIPEYAGEPYVSVNGNIPFFKPEELSTQSYESYSELDNLGRCGEAYACVGKETMPTVERGEICHIKPSGWNQAKYFGIVDSEPPYLYNRCHLIAFCLTGENDNERNLITGTRYLNVEGMLPWEEKVAKYVDETENHVLYRITPDFRDDELLARGVLIEAYSVEDKGNGICFNVYCYNVQPGVVIDYRSGESKEE